MGIIFKFDFSFTPEKQTCEREEEVTCSIQAKGTEGEKSFSFLMLLLFLLLMLLSLFPPSQEYSGMWTSVYSLQIQLTPLQHISFLSLNKAVKHHIDTSFGLCRLWLLFAGGESSEHPSILYQFDFGSLTNSSLRQIERELTQVGAISLHWQSSPPLLDVDSSQKLSENHLSLWCLGWASSLKPLLRQCPQAPHRSRLFQPDQKLLDGCKPNAKRILRQFWFVFAQYLSNVALDAGLRETANDIKKNWGEVDIALVIKFL